MGVIMTIRRATLADVPALAVTLAAAFVADPVSRWLFQPASELARQETFFQAMTAHAITFGDVYTTGDRRGAALWLDIDPVLQGSTVGVPGGVAEALGDCYPRFVVLDTLMRQAHPMTVAHTYLPFIGVAPPYQGQGLGLELLLAKLSTLHAPAYLEASNPISHPLYQQVGFQPLGAPITLPDGPTLRPMWWKPPQATSTVGGPA